MSQRRVFFIATTITLYILIVLGCSREQPHEDGGKLTVQNKGELTVKRDTSLPKQILKHNETSLSSGDWKLITWTNGYTYSQGEPIVLGLHLTFTGKGPQFRLKTKVLLEFTHEEDLTVVNRELTVPFKEVNRNPFEWEAIIADALKANSHPPGASILSEGRHGLNIQIKIPETVEFLIGGGKSTVAGLEINIDNVDSKNYYHKHNPSATRHNETSSSFGDWKLNAWTFGASYPSGSPIPLGLHLTFTGKGARPVPKATIQLKLTQVNGSTILSRELTVPPFKEVNKNPPEWEVIMADAFKTDAKRPGAFILSEGTYNITYKLIIDKDITIPGKVFSIKTPGRLTK